MPPHSTRVGMDLSKVHLYLKLIVFFDFERGKSFTFSIYREYKRVVEVEESDAVEIERFLAVQHLDGERFHFVVVNVEFL